MKIIAILSLIGTLLTGCSTTAVPPKKITTTDWHEATKQVVAQYSPDTDKEMKPYFEDADLTYPPKEVALLAFKDEAEMELWAKDDTHNNWQYVRTYDLTATSGKPGPKLRYGDYQMPEGVYDIVMLNPFSSWQLSMLISYPNEFDKMHAIEDGRDNENLGGDIYIHGNELSVGCLAIGDKAIDELFVLAARVGHKNFKVIISPNDLRESEPITDLDKQPEWVPELYAKLEEALKPFNRDAVFV